MDLDVADLETFATSSYTRWALAEDVKINHGQSDGHLCSKLPAKYATVVEIQSLRSMRFVWVPFIPGQGERKVQVGGSRKTGLSIWSRN